jgi:hypothetical protein
MYTMVKDKIWNYFALKCNKNTDVARCYQEDEDNAIKDGLLIKEHMKLHKKERVYWK